MDNRLMHLLQYLRKEINNIGGKAEKLVANNGDVVSTLAEGPRRRYVFISIISIKLIPTISI
jgi:hypothetical protein